MYDVAIVGGGLAGLVNSILLKKEGFSVVLFEEKKYPFHRVCGEYVSNEVIPFLERNEIFPHQHQPVDISNFHLSSTSGKSLKMDLDLGGFGISRYTFDHFLAEKARLLGVEVREEERVTQLTFAEELFQIETAKGNYVSKLAIGSFGKRAKLDKELNRKFINKRSPYIGVKYHIKTSEVPIDAIELHNFRGGYCGVSRVEDEVFNLCYLSHRDNLKSSGEIPLMERQILYENPFLKRIFENSEFLFQKPEVINEISFEPKEPVVNHILMSGDSAGMITPLCGNGMAMAIHSSKLLNELAYAFLKGTISREQLEKKYTHTWRKTFAKRHWAGRKIQGLFGSKNSSEFAVGLGNTFKPIAGFLMSQTHGQPF